MIPGVSRGPRSPPRNRNRKPKRAADLFCRLIELTAPMRRLLGLFAGTLLAVAPAFAREHWGAIAEGRGFHRSPGSRRPMSAISSAPGIFVPGISSLAIGRGADVVRTAYFDSD
jgi:hypothetical protein